jgi:hypothetical protein
MTIRVDSEQTIYDIALIAYGDAGKVYLLIAENPTLIDSILSNLTGLTLNYTPASVTRKEAVVKPVTKNINVTIQSTQTLFDIALQYYGSADKVYQLLSENPTIENILSTDYVGKTLNYTISKLMTPTYYRNNSITISTKDFYIATPAPASQFLLQEDGTGLLQEDGTGIILE